jgi:hypothetical protein
MHEHLGVAHGPEAMPESLELGRELLVVVRLAVVGDDDTSLLALERLRATGEVDDAEAHVREADHRAGEEAVAVRAAMMDRGRHPAERLEVDTARP